ncbi:MAG: hypothetical protein ACRETQ_03065 [Gammaproteobacteria bacterium]
MLVKMPHYRNVSVLLEPLAELRVPAKVDVVFTSQNYHDLHDPFWGADKKPLDMTAFNKSVYEALKPGGVYVIVDHRAPNGSGISATNTLHRIDPASVRAEVEAAGFQFDGSSHALENPKDPLNVAVFDKSIRGHTSQFIMRFRKPER